MDEKIEIKKEEYEMMKKQLEEIELKRDKTRQQRNEWTYKYVNKPENIEKIKEKRREYARIQYEKNKNDEEYMIKRREKALENYYKRKNVNNNTNK